MKMDNVSNNENDIVDPSVESEKKMMKLMEEMQAQAQSPATSHIPTINDANTASNVGVNIKTDNNINYWEIDDLPTKYRLYPEGTRLTARPLKVLEVKKLTSLNESNADSIVNDILRKCVRGIDINEIYSADKMYILLWLRANSYRDPNYTVGYNCSLCNKDSTYHFTVDKIDVEYLSDEYNPDDELTLSNSDKIKVKLLQIKDEIATTSFHTRYDVIFNNSGDGIDDELLSLAFMIECVNGVVLDPIQKYNYILDMDPGDFSALTTRLSDTSVGINPAMGATCTECGGESQIGVTFQPDFFLPRFTA